MTLSLILTILGALLLQFGAFKLQKYFNDKKAKELNDKLSAQDSKIKGLEQEKEQRSREQVAGSEHRKRVKLTKKKSKALEDQIREAKSEEEILAILHLIDADNSFRVGL